MISDKALEKWLAEHAIVLGSEDVGSDVNKIISAVEAEFGETHRTWSYFLEDYEGNVIKEVHNVRIQDAPRGAEEDDEGEILGHWHPFLPD